MEILNVDKINKSFGKKQVLFDVSFSMDEGDILAFIGPNGAGKTTAIKLILGLQKMDSGKVSICGLDNKKNFEEAMTKVGSIVESPDMYMYLSGYQNLKLVSRMYDNITEEKIRDIIKLVGLEKSIHMKVSKYSLGMRQRLGIAQALLNDPKLLIFDEPTNGLDPEGIKELRELFKNIAKSNKGILISSHNLRELETFCNKVAIIKKGKIIVAADINEFKKLNTKDTYVIETDKNDETAKLLKGEIMDGKVIFNTDDLNKSLMKIIDAKIKITKVLPEEQSLEDAFIEMAGGQNE